MRVALTGEPGTAAKVVTQGNPRQKTLKLRLQSPSLKAEEHVLYTPRPSARRSTLLKQEFETIREDGSSVDQVYIRAPCEICGAYNGAHKGCECTQAHQVHIDDSFVSEYHLGVLDQVANQSGSGTHSRVREHVYECQTHEPARRTDEFTDKRVDQSYSIHQAQRYLDDNVPRQTDIRGHTCSHTVQRPKSIIYGSGKRKTSKSSSQVSFSGTGSGTGKSIVAHDAEWIKAHGSYNRSVYLSFGGDKKIKEHFKSLQNNSELDQGACYSFQFVLSSFLEYISRPLLVEILDYLLRLNCNDDRFYLRTLKLMNALGNDQKSVRHLVDSDMILKVMPFCENPNLQAKAFEVIMMLTAELSTQMGQRQVFDYFWKIFEDELEKPKPNTNHLSVCISILSNLMSQRSNELCKQIIEEGKIAKIVDCIHRLEYCESGLIPAIGSLCILCYDNESDHDARVQSMAVFPMLIRILQKLRPNFARLNYEDNGLTKVTMVLVKALVSDNKVPDGDYVTKLVARIYTDLSYVMLDLHEKRCLHCKTVVEILESALGTLHILSRDDQNCEILSQIPNFISTLEIKHPVGVGLFSIDPNMIRHSVGILSELSKHPRNIRLIQHLSDAIWGVLSHSVTESTSHYAALCLYNLSPREFEKRIEEKLFLRETRVRFAKGLLKEKWIQRIIRKKPAPIPEPIPVLVQEPVLLQALPPKPKPIQKSVQKEMQYNLEGDIEVKTELQLIDVKWSCVSSSTDWVEHDSKYDVVY